MTLPYESTHRPARPAHAEDQSVDAQLRSASVRQRRALAPAPDAARPSLTLHRATHPAMHPAAPHRAWPRVLAAAATLALLAGGWWALNPSPSPAPVVAPIAHGPASVVSPPTPRRPEVGTLLAGAWSALGTPLGLLGLLDLPDLPHSSDAAAPLARLTTLHVTDPLTTEFTRIQADLRRVFTDLPSVSLRWDTPPNNDEPRTHRPHSSAFPWA